MSCPLITIILLCCYTISHVTSDGMNLQFEWKQMDYYDRGSVSGDRDNGDKAKPPHRRSSTGGIVFPDRFRSNAYKRETEKITSRNAMPETATRFGKENEGNYTTYIAYNNVPMGATHFRGKLFITMPRRRIGIPSTLNYIDMERDGNNKSPKLYAYPDYDTNYLNPKTLRPNPNGLVSVYRTTVDECQRLWFIDTGMLEYPNNRMQIQRPAIWTIDLKTNRVVNRFEIPEDVIPTGQGLASITIDLNPKQCEKAFAYIPDLVNNRLNVYSLEKNRIWSFSHNYFNFDPLAGDLNIAGQRFRWDDGIFSITLGPRSPFGTRPAFFHAMASNNEFGVSTGVLKEEANAARSDHGDDFRFLGSRGVNKQSTSHEYDDSTGVVFYNEIQQNGVGCWNIKNPLTPENHGTVFRDDARMIYPSDMTIDEEGYIWVMSNTMPAFIYSSLDPNEVNFRVWKQHVREAIRNTICE